MRFSLPFAIQQMDWTRLGICSVEELDTELGPRKFWIKPAQILTHAQILIQLRTLGKIHFSTSFSCIKWQHSNRSGKEKTWQWARPVMLHARLLASGTGMKPEQLKAAMSTQHLGAGKSCQWGWG